MNSKIESGLSKEYMNGKMIIFFLNKQENGRFRYSYYDFREHTSDAPLYATTEEEAIKELHDYILQHLPRFTAWKIFRGEPSLLGSGVFI